MKKIYLLFSLLFAITWQAANAQAFMASDAPSNGSWASKTYWYNIKNGNGNGYVMASAESSAWYASESVNSSTINVFKLTTASLQGNDYDLWCVVGDETNGYKFYNKGIGADKVLGLIYVSGGATTRATMVDATTEHSSGTSTTDVATTFLRKTITNSSSADLFYAYGTSNAMNYRDGYLAYWNDGNWDTSNSGNSFVFTVGDDVTAALQSFYNARKAFNTAYASLGTLTGYTWTASDNVFGLSQTAIDALSTAYSTAATTYNKYVNEELVSTNTNISTDAITELTEATTAINSAISTFESAIKLPTTSTDVTLRNCLHSSDYLYATSSLLMASSAYDSYTYKMTFVPVTAGENKFYLYNEYQGLYVASTPSANNTAHSMVSYTDGDDTDSRGVFSIKAAPNGTIIIYNPSESSNNAIHEDNYNRAVRWNTEYTTQGSHFYVDTDLAEDAQAWANALIAQTTNTHKSIGGFKIYAGNEGVSTAVTALQSTVSLENYKALEAAMAAVTETTATAPITGHYYTITSAQDDNYRIYEDYDNTKPVSNAIVENENLVPAMWTFVEAGTGDSGLALYNIQGANLHSGTAYYISSLAWDTTTPMTTTAVPFSIMTSSTTYTAKSNSESGSDNYVTKANSVSLRWYANGNTKYYDGTISVGTGSSTPSGDIKTYNAAGEYSNNWYVEEVTEIPVTVTAAGYATLCLPFAVTVPTDGKIGVYTASIAANSESGDDEISLTEIADGTTVPAKTPVVLVAEGGATETFAIDYDKSEEATSTALTGILAPEELTSNSGKYILKNGDDGIGFYLVNSETTSKLSANRAYLLYTKSSSTSVLKFNLGDETTGIHAIATDKAANAYYDLQGRRVLYPVHGVFVKGNGQKVYIK